MSGSVSYYAGLSAEDQVSRRYARDGHTILSRRWRGKAGEIDLVAEKDGTVIFIEVKKSSSHARAAERLRLLSALPPARPSSTGRSAGPGSH